MGKKLKFQSTLFVICVIVVLFAEILTLVLKGKTLSDTAATIYGTIVAASYVAEIIGFIALICMILYDNTYHYFENLKVKKIITVFYGAVFINLFAMMFRLIDYHIVWSILNIIVSIIMVYCVLWLELKDHHKYD
ncbi:hypothetical protein [Mycoplasma sp. P36-A1]|uniref:hypothetical protein n=1 Tax=Mycoplasma sp. P36-A1 TaxID=3252900 RepID=UPI003C3082F6